MSQVNTKEQSAPKAGQTRKLLLIAIAALSAVLIFAVGAAVLLSMDRDGGPKDPTPDLTLPETVVLRERYLLCNSNISPELFVAGLEGTDIQVRFEEKPSLTLTGWQDVKLRFETQTQYCSLSTRVYCFTITDEVAVKMLEDREVTVRDYIADENVEAAFGATTPAEVDRSVCGKTPLKLICDGIEYDVIFHVEDNVPPRGTGVAATFEAGTAVDPATLVENIVDHSEVTVTFAEAVDLTVIGRHTVKLLLTDAYGNTATVETEVTVTKPRIEPEFTGMGVIYIQVGETIAYKKGVTCTDPQDGSLTYTVDKSQVDTATEGVYYVTYSATDSDGNTTTLQRKVVVEMVTREVVERYAQKVLDKIIKEGMTRDQKINAVYKYTQKAVAYIGTSDKSSIVMGAYEGFTSGLGDCYTYYAMNVIMFEMLGIENMEVTRIGGTSHHWWNLVLFEDGMYYHVDSCPVYQKVSGINHGKLTETDLVTYTNAEGVINRRPNFYVYDHTLPQYQGIQIAP